MTTDLKDERLLVYSSPGFRVSAHEVQVGDRMMFDDGYISVVHDVSTYDLGPDGGPDLLIVHIELSEREIVRLPGEMVIASRYVGSRESWEALPHEP